VLAQETSVLLLDEPTSNLDINYQIEIMQLIKSIKAERELTVMAIFHDMNLAAQFADRIIFIKNGEIMRDDTPEKTLRPDTIHSVYNAHVLIEQDPYSKKPLVVPLYHYRNDGNSEPY
jgi:iron complex transport system ATP-binding protein